LLVGQCVTCRGYAFQAAVIELEQRAKRGYGVQFGRDIV